MKKFNRQHFGAVVILYNPTKENLGNIEGYANLVARLLVIDNSESHLLDLRKHLEDYPNVLVIQEGVNLGIGKRLNQALDFAKEIQLQWLLTMDQDSCFNEGELQQYLMEVAAMQDAKRVALVGVSPVMDVQEDDVFTDVITNITSGSLVNVPLAAQLNGFEEKLFIDEVDTDFCYRSILNGYKVKRYAQTHLVHQFGNDAHISMAGGKKLKRTVYDPVRLYYMIRNFFFVKNKYEHRFPSHFKEREKQVLNIVKNNLLYRSDRFKSMNMVLKGWKDYKKNNWGRLQ